MIFDVGIGVSSGISSVAIGGDNPLWSPDGKELFYRVGEVYRALAKEMPPSSLPIANGARLGWLLEPRANCGTIYRPGQTAQLIREPTILSGDLVLPGFHVSQARGFNSLNQS